MPYIRVETNVDLSGKADNFLTDLSGFTADNVGKPEAYVMVSVHDNVKMSFGGKADPAALLTLKSLGLQADQCKELSEKLCGFLGEKIGVPADRIYIEFADHERAMFGWNGGTFG